MKNYIIIFYYLINPIKGISKSYSTKSNSFKSNISNQNIIREFSRIDKFKIKLSDSQFLEEMNKFNGNRNMHGNQTHNIRVTDSDTRRNYLNNTRSKSETKINLNNYTNLNAKGILRYMQKITYVKYRIFYCQELVRKREVLTNQYYQVYKSYIDNKEYYDALDRLKYIKVLQNQIFKIYDKIKNVINIEYPKLARELIVIYLSDMMTILDANKFYNRFEFEIDRYINSKKRPSEKDIILKCMEGVDPFEQINEGFKSMSKSYSKSDCKLNVFSHNYKSEESYDGSDNHTKCESNDMKKETSDDTNDESTDERRKISNEDRIDIFSRNKDLLMAFINELKDDLKEKKNNLELKENNRKNK